MYALRTLRKDLGFTTVVVATLALGIGANTGIFSIVRAALTPVAVPESDRVVVVYTDNGTRQARSLPFSVPDFLDLSDSGVFSRVAAFDDQGVNYRVGERAERLSALFVTSGFFEIAGVPPLFGRLFNDRDAQPGSEPVAVLTEATWRSRFAAQIEIIGRSILVDGIPRVIVGVV